MEVTLKYPERWAEQPCSERTTMQSHLVALIEEQLNAVDLRPKRDQHAHDQNKLLLNSLKLSELHDMNRVFAHAKMRLITDGSRHYNRREKL